MLPFKGIVHISSVEHRDYILRNILFIFWSVSLIYFILCPTEESTKKSQ